MTRESFARSIFLDDRIHHGGRQALRVPLDPLLAAHAGPVSAERSFGVIFHVAQCGSTLLARALDHPGRSLVLREPAALRHLGLIAGAGDGRAANASDPRFVRLLEFTLAMLGKRWGDEGPVIVKANVPVNFIADEVLTAMPSAPALLLHFPLEPYLLAILRSEGHVAWVSRVFEEMALAANEYVAPDAPRTAATQAAALWFAQMKQFETVLDRHTQAQSLDAERFFAESAPVIAAAADYFGVVLREDEAREIAASDLFTSYSKNPTLDYDPEVREARAAEAKRRLSAEIGTAIEWARAAKARHGLVEALARPLIGAPVALLP